MTEQDLEKTKSLRNKIIGLTFAFGCYSAYATIDDTYTQGGKALFLEGHSEIYKGHDWYLLTGSCKLGEVARFYRVYDKQEKENTTVVACVDVINDEVTLIGNKFHHKVVSI